MAVADLSDAGCWLEQAGAIVEMIAVTLDDDKRTGTALVSSLYGAISLIRHAREVTDAEADRLSKGGR